MLSLNISGLIIVPLMVVATFLGFYFPLKLSNKISIWLQAVVFVAAFIFAFVGVFVSPLWLMFVFEGLMVCFLYLYASYMRFQISNIERNK